MTGPLSSFPVHNFEVFGIPGSGKSFVLDYLEKEVSQTGNSYRQPKASMRWPKRLRSLEIGFRVAKRMMGAPFFFFLLFRCKKLLRKDDRKRFRRNLNRTLLRTDESVPNDEGVLVIESEGLTQRLLSLCESLSPEQIGQYLPRLTRVAPLPTTIFLMNTPAKLCHHRLQQRAIDHPQKRATANLERLSCCARVLGSHLAENGHDVIVLDGTQTKVELASQIVNAVASRVTEPMYKPSEQPPKSPQSFKP